MAVSLVQILGLGKFDAIQLRKKLAIKLVKNQPYLNEFKKVSSGSVSPRDIGTLLQMLYQYFENLRFDQDAFLPYMDRLKTN